MAIVITELDEREQFWLEDVLQMAQDTGQTVKISQHPGTGQIMVKRGGGVWSAPIGKDVTERPEADDTVEGRATRASEKAGE